MGAYNHGDLAILIIVLIFVHLESFAVDNVPLLDLVLRVINGDAGQFQEGNQLQVMEAV